jgi:hypothetical protein
MQDRNTALQDLAELLEDLPDKCKVRFSPLLNAYVRFLKEELDVLAEKMMGAGRTAITQFSHYYALLKDLVHAIGVHDPDCLDTRFLVFVQTVLKKYEDIKPIVSQFTKLLHQLVSIRPFREKLTPVQWEELISYCISFFTEDPENVSTQDRRGECADLAMVFCHLVTCQWTDSVMEHADHILKFISQYIKRYSFENSSFEIFLNTAIQVLLLLDVDQLDLSFQFVKAILPRLIDFVSSKTESLRLASIHLLRMYIVMGSDREEDDVFLRNASRMQAKLYDYITKHTIAPIPTLVFHQLLVKPDYEKEFPSGLMASWAYVSLFADLCWLETHSCKDRTESQSTESQSTLIAERPNKRIRTKDIKSYPQILLNDKSQACFGLQVLVRMMYRRPSTIDHVVDDQFRVIVNLAVNGDLNCVNEARMCCMAIMELRPAFSFDTTELLDRSLISINQTVVGYHGTFLLLARLVKDKRISSKSILSLLDWVCNLKPDQVSRYTANLVKELLEFTHLWSHTQICSLLSFLFRILRMEGKALSNQVLLCFIDSIRLVFQCPRTVQTQNNPWESDFSVAEESAVFDMYFDRFERRLDSVSGYNGSKLVLQLWPVIHPMELNPQRNLPQTIYQHISLEISSLLDHILESMTMTRISIDPLLAFICVCLCIKTVVERNDKFALDSLLYQKLELVSTKVFTFVRNVEVDPIFAKFLEIAPEFKKNLFFPLPDTKCIDLMEICLQQCLKPTARLVERDLKSPKYQILQTSTFSEPLDIKRCLKTKAWLRILSRLTSHECFALDSLTSQSSTRLHLWFSKILQSSKDSMASIIVLGNHYELLHQLLDGPLVSLILSSYIKLIENPKYCRNFHCWTSCLRFLKVLLSKKPTLVTGNTEYRIQISELVSFFHSSWESISNAVAMELVDVLILTRDVGIAIQSVNDHNMEITKFLVLDSFASKFFAAKCIVPSLSPVTDWEPYLEGMLQWDTMSDVNAIGNSLILGSVMYHNPDRFSTYFVHLAKIASLYASLDTPDNLLQKLSQHFMQPSIKDLSQQGLEYALQLWDFDCIDFPYFLFGADSLEHFAEVYCGQLCLVSFRNRDHKWHKFASELLSNGSIWIGKALPIVYAEYLYQIATNPSSKTQGKLYLQSIFNITEEEYHRTLKMEYSTTLFLLLSKMSGLNRFAENLDSYLAAELAIYELPFQSDVHDNSAIIIKAIETLCSSSLVGLSRSISAQRFLDILQKFHLFLQQVGFEKEIKRILSNGYLVCWVLGKVHLKHPLVFSSVFVNLADYIHNSSLAPYCSPLLIYLIGSLSSPFPESFPKQAMKLMMKLNEVAISTMSDSLEQLPIICKMIDMLLEKVQSCDEKAMGVCQLLIDSALTPYLQRFRVKENYLESVLMWPEGLDDYVFESNPLLSRMSDYLDKLQPHHLGIDRLICKLEQMMKNRRDSAVKDWHLCLAKLYGKVLSNKRKHTTLMKKADSATSILEVALKELTEFLLSWQLNLQVTSMKVIVDVCSTNAGHDAFRCLPVDHRCVLDILQQKSIVVAASAPHVKSPHTEEIWSSKGKERASYFTEFACGILSSFPFPNFVQYLKPMIDISGDFAEKMIPYLCCFALEIQRSQSVLRSWFFDSIRRTLENDYESNSLCVELCVNIVRELFLNQVHLYPDEIPLHHVARMALRMGDFHTSLYFLELAYSESPVCTDNSQWQIMIDCYKNLNESDGFQGALHCLDTSQMEMVMLVKQNLERHRDWLALWSLEDALQDENSEDHTSLCKALSNSGHYNTLLSIAAKSNQQSSEMYESLWRMGKWDISTAEVLEPKEDFQHHIYQTLKCYEVCYSPAVASELVETYLKLVVVSRPTPTEVVSLMEIHEFVSTEGNLLGAIKNKWMQRRTNLLAEYGYGEHEPIFSVRNRLLYASLKKQSDSLVDETLEWYVDSQLNLANVAIENKDLMLSRRVLKELHSLRGSMSEEQRLQLQFESIKTEWQSGQFTIPMRYLEKMIAHINENHVHLSKLYSSILLTMGIWSIERKSAVSGDILERYLKRSIQYLEKTTNYDRGKHYFTIASYCDAILTEMQTDQTFKRSVALLAKREASLAQALANGHSQKDHFVRRLEKQIDIDKQLVAVTFNEMTKLSSESVKNYLKVLIHSEYRSEHSLYRFFSLWFSSSADNTINRLIADELPGVPSKTFLPLMYQITARLFSQNQDEGLFFRTLMSFVQSIVLDYPFHTLGFVLALRNVSKAAAKSKSTNQAICGETISSFMGWIKKNKPIQIIAYHMDSMFNGYITTAYQAVPKSKDSTKKHSLESSCSLFKIKPEHMVPVITAEQPMHQPRVYNDILHVVGFEKSFTVPGGINAPKVIKCQGSDGVLYKQLVKGKGYFK